MHRVEPGLGAAARGILPSGVAARLVSLDQFRGYTVLGMFVVNFLGAFTATPALLKHHNTYFSYADSIMPQFFFAVGFAYRLTFLRGLASGDRGSVCWRIWRRNLKLILLGAVIYVAPAAVIALARSPHPSLSRFVTEALQGDLFQTLVHIGVTALWIMPVIGARPAVRLLFAAGSAGLHLGLSHWFYYDWVTTVGGIDGGILGFLTWTIPMIAGSLAYDLLVRTGKPGNAIGSLLGWGAGLMVLGYGLSCLNLATPPNAPAHAGLCSWLVEPPFVPPTHPVNLWTMSQQAGSVTYLTFGAGLSLVLYAGFVWACDVRRIQIGIWRTLGSNALAGYVIHGVACWGFGSLLLRRAPLETVLLALFAYSVFCYGCVRVLEWKRIYWRM
jgi:predicted acyltransferase